MDYESTALTAELRALKNHFSFSLDFVLYIKDGNVARELLPAAISIKENKNLRELCGLGGKKQTPAKLAHRQKM